MGAERHLRQTGCGGCRGRGERGAGGTGTHPVPERAQLRVPGSQSPAEINNGTCLTPD